MMEMGAQGDRLRDEGIEQADAAVSEDWKAQAESAVRHLAETQQYFTADDVWFVLSEAGAEMPDEPRALAATMTRAKRGGLIVADGIVKTERPRRHSGYMTRWRSLLWRG